MSFLRFFCLMILFVVSTQLYADEEDSSDDSKSNGSELIRSKRYVYAAVGGGLTGMDMHAGVYLPYDTALELSSQYLEYPASQVKALRIKKFFGNSFYGSAEFGGGKSLAGMESSEHYGARMHYEMVGIGNEWYLFDHVFVGCEWIAAGSAHWRDLNHKAEKDKTGDSSIFRVGTVSVGVAF